MKLNEHIYWQNKARFDLKEDRYETWTLFAVEEGSFRFEIVLPDSAPPLLEPPPMLPLAGEAGFGGAVLCPPGGVLRRETVTPLTFHYVQFEGSEEQSGVCPWMPGLLTFEDVRRLRSNYAHLRRAEGDASPEGRAWTLHLALDLLRLHETERRRELRPEARFTEDALMALAAAEIEARFGAPLPLEALAAELGLSPVQFTRRFRAAFGETPSRFLKSLRLARARRLLGDTELTLAEIAERCGYENGFYLSRVFTAETGLPPSEYRRRRRV
ncbi:hypothetical protein CDO73_10675 [Saccharibacillus sp. O23]|uniref:helix-turn-helix domain-containing protein n=1 Tax=Saccharibacillus sp. O23 TaxID=2009338 RepID=UPI000B4E7A79|nr:AraC family transcriptional regulator [Saccharibacillus sp. O23]OWR30378.1 hypothetical protein CDO73_10675 [Saccharibacillus sp. O23]